MSKIIQLHDARKLGDENIVASIEEISPQTATRWLRCNRLNRPVRRAHVAFLSREISDGLWQLNGQAIVISDSEDVLDGQHRLLAVIDAGIPIKSLVVYGVGKEAFKTIDTGAVRTGSDALSVWYPGRAISLVRAVGRAVSWCMAFDRGVIRHADRVANAEVIEYVAGHASLWRCGEEILGYPKEGRFMSPALGTALYELFARKGRNDAKEFMFDLFANEPIDTDKPSYVLRSMLERDKRRISGSYPASVKARMTIKAWNIARSGKSAVASPTMIAVNTRDGERFTIK
jgi:hypothetical protein